MGISDFKVFESLLHLYEEFLLSSWFPLLRGSSNTNLLGRLRGVAHNSIISRSIHLSKAHSYYSAKQGSSSECIRSLVQLQMPWPSFNEGCANWDNIYHQLIILLHRSPTVITRYLQCKRFTTFSSSRHHIWSVDRTWINHLHSNENQIFRDDLVFQNRISEGLKYMS